MDMSTVKVILALSSTWGVDAKHDDIANACVKDDKEADLHILSTKGNQGLVVSSDTLKKRDAESVCELVLQLRKSLYGLEQAGRLWSQLSHARMIESGSSSANRICVTEEAIERFIGSLGSLSIIALGAVSIFLGMRVTVDDDGRCVVDQEGAIGELLRERRREMRVRFTLLLG